MEGMETLPITLIVKAPNQQIEDQTIKCELSWTIQKLKQHLSEVYPNKPPKHEQKLIYSGQLLTDSLTLKDVLRQYDGQETHTVHLVCASKYTKIQDSSQKQSNANITPNTTANMAQSQTPPENATTAQSIPNVNPIPNIPWVNVNGAATIPLDANQYAMQLAWMQQAYYQYMAQYMQLAATSYGVPLSTPPTADSSAAQPQANAAPVDQPAPQPPAGAAAAAPRADDPEQQRDWLDVFYALSRALVLFSVVYFYSSPMRFIFVLLLGISLYLYQIGFFRNINNNNNNNNTREPAEVEEEQAPSRLMIVWTFFATFFASLIPEIPNAV